MSQIARPFPILWYATVIPITVAIVIYPLHYVVLNRTIAKRLKGTTVFRYGLEPSSSLPAQLGKLADFSELNLVELVSAKSPKYLVLGPDSPFPSPNAFSSFAKLPNLEGITVSARWLTAEHLEMLGASHSLQRIDLTAANLSDTELERVRTLLAPIKKNARYFQPPLVGRGPM